jgi:GntR family transcriptional regulator
VSEHARYEQVAADLIKRIKAGEWPPGARMPSKVELRQQYGGIAHGTLSQAFDLVLKPRGWIETRSGLGTYVCDPLPDPDGPSEYEQVMTRLGQVTDELRQLRAEVAELRTQVNAR